MENLKRKQVNVLFLILFTDMIGFGMSIPLFGILFGNTSSQFYLGNAITPSILAFSFGIFTALYGLGQFLANPILGSLSDSIGRKPVLSFAIFGTFLARILFIIGLLRMNVVLMFISRFVDGGTGGIISLANASITDTTEAKDRAKYIGRIMAGFSLGGFVVGPIIFTLFSYTGDFWSVVGPFAIATGLSVLAFLACVLFFPETLPKEKIQSIPNLKTLWEKLIHSLDNLKIVMKDKSSRPFFLSAGIFYLGFAAYTTFAAPFLTSHYGLSSQMLGLYFLFVGIIMVIMQGFLAYKIVNIWPFKKNILYVGIILGVAMLLFAFNFNLFVLFISAFLIAVFVSLSMVGMQTEVSKHGSENKGAVMGAFSSIQVLSMAISPIIAGILSGISVVLPFVLSGVLLLVGGFSLKKSTK